MEVKRKIVLITAGQPSTNPRLVKEADSLSASGFQVTVIYQHIIEWADASDTTLLRDATWKSIEAGGHPKKEKLIFRLSRLKYKLFTTLNRILGNNFGIAERAQLRSYDEMLAVAKSIPAEWYIGHNLGALAVAVNAARYNNAKAAFDFEDYHRGESSRSKAVEWKRVKFLEEKYAAHLGYVSAASPLISSRILKDFPALADKIFTINNCFPKSVQPVFRDKNPNDTRLDLFWFSQTIGMKRGLELLIEAMVKLNDPAVHLTLAGKRQIEFDRYLESHANSIAGRVHFAGIVPPAELPAFSSRFDVGLALELSEPENRDLCLTNKVFTYMLAGNAMILSETSMQRSFNQQYQVGESFAQNDVEQLMNCIKMYKDPGLLLKQRKHNYTLASESMNWETEFRKLEGRL